MKELLKRLLPTNMQILLYRGILHRLKLFIGYRRDRLRYFKYGSSFSYRKEYDLLGKIITHYHVVEKGLTMSDMRYGFGSDKIKKLIHSINCYVTSYEMNDQVIHAVSVLKEYKAKHEEKGFQLEEEVRQMLSELSDKFPDIQPCNQYRVSRDEFFDNSNFYTTAHSRHSLRNYGGEAISERNLRSALELATTTPTACNRQPIKTRTLSDSDLKEQVLNLQGGNRGFGHQTDKLIVVTASLRMYAKARERNAAYVDGGLYCMNLLYSLHYYGIGACILNASFDIDVDTKIRKLLDIDESEVFIAMITCGLPPSEFMVPISKRNNVDHTNIFIS
ncbi:nitroreductase family protein [Carboxylicivirga sp. RSCT41]|uniref:nitroreductase family protein n=1 Tax=Carboxylicivirga agarovorans TaxID=3417570 RepID=UPI003D34A5FC